MSGKGFSGGGFHLPGKPDLVLAKYNAVIFVHGCFWHHHDCRLFKWPKSNAEFWRDKITANTQRDKRYNAMLEEDDCKFLIVWECALNGKPDQEINKAFDQISSWLLSDNNTGEIS